MPQNDRWIPSACSMCYSVCAIKAHVVDDVLVKIEGNPDSATNRGRICARGMSGIMTLYDPARVNVPLKRTNPEKGIGIDPGWVEISWDEALDTIADRLRKLRDDDPRKLLFTITVAAMDESQVGRLFAMTFGSPNVWNSGAGNHCGNAEHLIGGVMHAAWSKQPDTTHCNYLLNFGCSSGFGSYYAVTAMVQRMAEARVRGMRHVVIDPFLSPSAEKADEWIPIRPGTDAVFALAMLNLMLNEYGLYDEPHLREHTNAPYLVGEDGRYVRDPASGKPLVFDETDGRAKPFDAEGIGRMALDGRREVLGVSARPAFTVLREHVRECTPEWAAEITTIPADTIRRVTREFGEAARIGSTIVLDGKPLPYRPVGVLYFKGAQGHKGATLTSLAIELLLEVVGGSNVPGGVLGMNGCSLGHPETGRPAWIPFAGKDGLLVPGMWQSPPPPYPPKDVEIGATADLRSLFPTIPASSGGVIAALKEPEKFGIPYRVEVNMHLGTNYLMTMSNPRQVAEAFRPLYQISTSLFLDESTDLSDIVLPAASYLERLTPIPDWMSSISPVDEWSYHVRQPVIAPMRDRRSVADILLELVERLDMREDYYTVVNTVWGLQGDLALDPARRYSWDELIDRQYRAKFGGQFGLDWFKEHGVLKWPKRVEEVYWLPFSKARVPIYLEWMLGVREQVEQATRQLHLDLDTSAFAPLPGWQPCAAHTGEHDGHDLFAVYYRLPLQTFSGTYNNPWLAELSETHPFLYRAAINTETARRKGIADGDWIRITSAVTGDSVRMRAALTQGIHPEVIAVAGCGGHWARGLPIASRPEKGGCFEWLMPAGLDHQDLPSMTQDQCMRVRVIPDGHPA